MLNRDEIRVFVADMAFWDKNMNPFGKPYIGDLRYKVWALCGHGNGHIDTTYGHVGNYQFKLVVNHDIHRVVSCEMLRPEEYFYQPKLYK